MNIDETISNGDPAELLEVWQRGDERRTWERVRESANGTDDPAETLRVAEWQLAKIPDVGPLDMLRANRRLVVVMTGRRWYAMQAAREAGASWSAIGDALGMTKQAAWAWYREKIEQQATYAPEFHDAERARAALADES